MADPKKFNKGKIRVRESVNDGPRNLPSVNETTIIGGIESYLESIGSDLARGILSLIIGDHLERTSADKIIISENSMEIGKIMEKRKLLLKINCCC